MTAKSLAGTVLAGPQRYPATIARSVRRPVLLWGLSLPLLIFLLLAAGGWLTYDWLNGIDREQRTISERYNQAVARLDDREAELKALAPTTRRLSAKPGDILLRVNALIAELNIGLERMTDKVPLSELVALPPMKTPAAGMELQLHGSPQRLHQFFAIIENEFPQLIVMKAEAHPVNDGLRYATTYLIAEYADITP